MVTATCTAAKQGTNTTFTNKICWEPNIDVFKANHDNEIIMHLAIILQVEIAYAAIIKYC